jgi:hypothetical protein
MVKADYTGKLEQTQINRLNTDPKKGYFERGVSMPKNNLRFSALKTGYPDKFKAAQAENYSGNKMMVPQQPYTISRNQPISAPQMKMELSSTESRVQMEVEHQDGQEKIQMKPEMTSVVQQGRKIPKISLSRMPSAGLHNMIQCQTARERPWGEVPGEFVMGSRQVNLFNHEFSQGTSLADALQWIFENSTARHTDFRFQDPDETMRSDIYQGMQEDAGQPSFYQEVALAWQIRRRRFVAFTLRSATSAAIDPSQGDYVFVAHTHPTPQQLQSGGRVAWNTRQPSPEDARRIQPQQRYSIVCHRDTLDNLTPTAFIFDSSGVVQSFSGQDAFQQAASRFFELERIARTTAARVVGRYRH